VCADAFAVIGRERERGLAENRNGRGAALAGPDGLKRDGPRGPAIAGALGRRDRLAEIGGSGRDTAEVRGGAGDDTGGLGVRVAEVMDGVQRRLHGQHREQHDQAEDEGVPPPAAAGDAHQPHRDDERQEDRRDCR